jgi:hypothetical protein
MKTHLALFDPWMDDYLNIIQRLAEGLRDAF